MQYKLLLKPVSPERDCLPLIIYALTGASMYIAQPGVNPETAVRDKGSCTLTRWDNTLKITVQREQGDKSYSVTCRGRNRGFALEEIERIRNDVTYRGYNGGTDITCKIDETK